VDAPAPVDHYAKPALMTNLGCEIWQPPIAGLRCDTYPGPEPCDV